MKNVLKKKNLIVSLLLLLAIFSVSAVNAGNAAFNPDLDITDAYYTELDQDGYENDIVAKYKLDLYFDDDEFEFDDDDDDDDGYTFFYVLIIALELPSGFTYEYIRVYYGIPEGIQTLIFYNHATEPGWYTLRIGCYLRIGRYTSYSYDELIFDPPGKSGGGEPYL